MLKATKILGVAITNETAEKISEYILLSLKTGKKKIFITTPNPEIIVYANSNLDYKDKLNSADVSLPDGMGLLAAALVLGRPLKSRIAGVDFIEMLCRDCREKPVSMGFLGAGAGIAEQAAQRLKKKYPWIEIVFVGEEWDFQKRVLSRPTSIDILFVAFGHPKQEEWIYENLPQLPVKVAMGVGGAFDYLSGAVPRAPKILRTVGLEWLFRLLIQPWRFKRQLALITFILLVIKEKLIGKE